MLNERVKNSHTTQNSNDITKENIIMRRILSAILAVISVFTVASPVFAQDITAIDYATEADSPAAVFDTEISSLPAAEQAYFDESESATLSADSDVHDSISNDDPTLTDNAVAIIYLCASGPHIPYFTGHAWVCIRNISEDNLTVGDRIITPGEMASFGLHSFNAMLCDEEMDVYAGETVRAREYELTQSDFDSAVREITASKWRWYELFTHNCTNFAISVWNEATGQNLVAFCFPFIVQLQIMFGSVGLVMSSR